MKIQAINIKNDSAGQTIQIPAEFKIDDDKVYLKKTGNVLQIIPFHTPWKNLLNSLHEFSPDFMDERQQPL